MAVMTDEPLAGRAAGRAGAMMRLAGGAVSLALMVGVGVWGYRLFVRDMTGIPVVRAMAGPMREAPAEPGGQIALHTGLAVNAVAALGEAAPPEDVLMLAPATAGLAPEDMEVQSMAEAGEVMAGVPDAPQAQSDEAGLVPVSLRSGGDPAPAAAAGAETAAEPVLLAVPETPMTAAEVLALADMIAAGAEPLAPLAPLPVSAEVPEGPQDAAAAVTETEGVAAPVERISAEVPGVRVALRPPARPGSVARTPDGSGAGAEAASLISGPVPAGTPLVQLGAYETAEIAAADWTVLAERFADFMGGKARVIQAAESGGEAFVRLRASGFADIEEANRFCAALIAEGARCVPVLSE
jgi:hypothetical protein